MKSVWCLRKTQSRITLPRVYSPELARQLYNNQFTTPHEGRKEEFPEDILVDWEELRPEGQVDACHTSATHDKPFISTGNYS